MHLAHLFITYGAIDAIRKDHPFHGPTQHVGVVLFPRLDIIQAAHEEEVRDLLDHLQRIGNPARPKGIPDLINLGPNFTCEPAAFHLQISGAQL